MLPALDWCCYLALGVKFTSIYTELVKRYCFPVVHISFPPSDGGKLMGVFGVRVMRTDDSDFGTPVSEGRSRALGKLMYKIVYIERVTLEETQ